MGSMGIIEVKLIIPIPPILPKLFISSKTERESQFGTASKYAVRGKPAKAAYTIYGSHT